MVNSVAHIYAPMCPQLKIIYNNKVIYVSPDAINEFKLCLEKKVDKKRCLSDDIR